MAAAAEDALGDRIVDGARRGQGRLSRRRRAASAWSRPATRCPTRAARPRPRRIRALAESAGADDLLLVLVSGGGSALTPAPVPPITLADKQAMTRLLLAAGATINQLNAVRKHCSLLKGGQLARAAAPARVHALLLSDVIGDPARRHRLRPHRARRVHLRGGARDPRPLRAPLAGARRDRGAARAGSPRRDPGDAEARGPGLPRRDQHGDRQQSPGRRGGGRAGARARLRAARAHPRARGRGAGRGADARRPGPRDPGRPGPGGAARLPDRGRRDHGDRARGGAAAGAARSGRWPRRSSSTAWTASWRWRRAPTAPTGPPTRRGRWRTAPARSARGSAATIRGPGWPQRLESRASRRSATWWSPARPTPTCSTSTCSLVEGR